jgi:dihydroneopterin aldolase
MTFRGRHGVLPEERRLGGDFRVEIEADVVIPPGFRDHISGTADYRALFSRARAIVERRRFRTLEALTGAVAAAALKVRRVRGVRVRVTKLAPPLGGGATAAVEIRAGSLAR